MLAVVAGAAVFELLDALSAGSGSSLNGRPEVPFSPFLLWLPVISPGIAGAVAAGVAPPSVIWSLIGAVAAVWGRIGADRLIGILQGAQLPPETGMVLILAFGVPWTLTAILGGVLLLAARSVLKRRSYRYPNA